jgi:hypothetical protein
MDFVCSPLLNNKPAGLLPFNKSYNAETCSKFAMTFANHHLDNVASTGSGATRSLRAGYKKKLDYDISALLFLQTFSYSSFSSPYLGLKSGLTQ